MVKPEAVSTRVEARLASNSNEDTAQSCHEDYLHLGGQNYFACYDVQYDALG